MSFSIVRNDIVKMQTEAIVNTANDHPTVGTGCDWAVYQAAGKEELLSYRKEQIGFVPEGGVFWTPGFKLPAKYIIHAVSPYYVDGEHGEEEKLRSCYRGALALAKELGVRSIAFPLISAGGFGYPREESFRIAREEILAFLENNDLEIYLVVFKKEETLLGKLFQARLKHYIDETYVANRLEEEYAWSNHDVQRRRRGLKDLEHPELSKAPRERNHVRHADSFARSDDHDLGKRYEQDLGKHDTQEPPIDYSTSTAVLDFGLPVMHEQREEYAAHERKEEYAAGSSPEHEETTNLPCPPSPTSEEQKETEKEPASSLPKGRPSTSSEAEEKPLSSSHPRFFHKRKLFTREEPSSVMPKRKDSDITILPSPTPPAPQSSPSVEEDSSPVKKKSPSHSKRDIFYTPPAYDEDAEEKLQKELGRRMLRMEYTFSEYLLELIEEKGMKSADVYKRALLDKKLFSKIKNNPDYQPTKITVLCLCVGARLSLDESKDLLARAGYAFSPSSKADIIFHFYIEHKIYDMIDLCITLEDYGLSEIKSL